MLLVVTLGNILEFYDFMLYPIFAGIFSKLYFPLSSPFDSLLITMAVFAVGFITRPLGGIIYGLIGDRLKRKTALIISITMMAIPTLLLCCLPSIKTIGISASILFVVFRMIQGVATGGELPGAMLVLTENAPPKAKAFISSFSMIGIVSGLILATLVNLIIHAIFTPHQIAAFGWRLAYLIGAGIGIVALVLRYKINELIDITPIKMTSSLLKDQLRLARPEILFIIGLQITAAVGFQLILLFPITIRHNLLHDNMLNTLMANLLGLISFGILTPIFAHLADRLGYKRVMLIACILLAVLTYPLYLLILSNNIFYIISAILILSCCLAMYYSALTAICIDLIHNQFKYTVLAIAHSITFSIFAGTAFLVAIWLIKVTENNASPAYYMIVASLISGLTLLLTKQRMIE